MAHGSTKGKPRAAPWKREEIARLAKLLAESPVVGVAEIGGIPAPQMQEMRASLRADVQIVGIKNRLLRLALAEAAKSRPGLAALDGQIDGQTAVVATAMNPFRLYKKLGEGATMAPIKGGAVAPMDITVRKGPTPFGPGPIVGDFQRVGIPAKIEGPKVVIQKNVTPVKAGEVVSAELALLLAKLEIKPVELKIRLKAAFEHDTVFMPDVLAIDDAKVMADLAHAVRAAYEVSLTTAFPTTLTAAPLVGRAFRQSAAVALESGVALGDWQDRAAEAYARILAGLGKKPEDLSEALRERLGKHIDILTAAPVAAAPAAQQAEAAPEEEEEEGVSEEEAAAGLGALFG